MRVAKQRKFARARGEINRLVAATPHSRVIQDAQNSILGLRALVEASDDAIIGKAIDGTIVSWNKGAEKMYGYTAGEIVGKSISVLMPPDHPNEFPEIMMRLGRGEHIERYETKRIRKNGNVIDASVTITPVKSPDGMVVGACVVARNITEQKRDQEALRVSEERFRIALKNAPVVVSSQDLQLRYTWISPLSLGLSQEDFLGRTDAEIFGGDEGARLTVIKEEVLRTGIESHAEVTVTLKGRTHYFDLLVEPFRDGRGTLLGLLCSGINITPLKEAFERERHWSHTDPLTGIPNRRSFFERLEAESHRAKRYNHPISVAYLDLDHFKQVNDALGHDTGDKLLAIVASTIERDIRQTDVVARLGGDEFALLMPETDRFAAADALRKLQHSLEIAMKQRQWPVTFSVGLVTFQPPPDSIQEIVNAADAAMYKAKKSGRARLIVYRPAA